MENKIKKIFIYNIAIVFIFLCAGCTGSVKRRTLTVTMSLGEQEWEVFRQDIFGLFEKKHNIKINAFQIESGQLATKLEALQSAGKREIDVFSQDNMELSALINKDLVSDLSEYEAQIPEEVLPNLVEACKYDDRLMFMPFRPNVQIVYYNQDAFDKYNLAVPRTWDELLEVAKIFQQEEGEGRVLLKAFGGNSTATQIYEFILQAGGEPYSFNDEGCIKAFTYLQELWPYASAESLRAKWDTSNTILARQQAYIGQNWPFGIMVLIQQYKLKQIKTYSGWKGPAGERHVIGGDVFGIPKNSRNLELALEFIRFMQSKQVQEILVSKLGWPSIRQDAYGKVEDWQRPYYDSVEVALKYGRFRGNVVWWPAYAKYVSEAFRKIVVEKADVLETLEIYKEKLEKEKSLYE